MMPRQGFQGIGDLEYVAHVGNNSAFGGVCSVSLIFIIDYFKFMETPAHLPPTRLCQISFFRTYIARVSEKVFNSPDSHERGGALHPGEYGGKGKDILMDVM